MKRLALLAACVGWVSVAGPVPGQKAGSPAPDFPPGLATDNVRYQLSDLKGKVVVLYFFESG